MFSFSHLLWLDQYLSQVHVQLSLESYPSYILALVPSPAPSDRSSGVLKTEYAVELRLNEVDYIILDSIDPSATEGEVYALLLQAIQGTPSAGYHCHFPLSMPILTIPSPMWSDIFSN